MQPLDYLDHLNPEQVSLDSIAPDQEVVQKVPASFAYRNKVFPINMKEGILTVVMSDQIGRASCRERV